MNTNRFEQMYNYIDIHIIPLGNQGNGKIIQKKYNYNLFNIYIILNEYVGRQLILFTENMIIYHKEKAIYSILATSPGPIVATLFLLLSPKLKQN